MGKSHESRELESNIYDRNTQGLYDNIMDYMIPIAFSGIMMKSDEEQLWVLASCQREL